LRVALLRTRGLETLDAFAIRVRVTLERRRLLPFIWKPSLDFGAS